MNQWFLVIGKTYFCKAIALCVMGLLCLGGAIHRSASLNAAEENKAGDDVLRRDNLVAWCIVPFDAKRRSPAQRAAMLKELGIKRSAYDWRDQHVPDFEAEIQEYQKQGIEFFAFWGEHESAFKLFAKYKLRPQIWQMLGEIAGETQEAKVETAVQKLLPLARRTAAMGCPLGIYNHGGWSGEPRNMVAVCERLRDLGQDHVGIVYNFHHGHEHITDWSASFALMKPWLLCLNLNGMNATPQPKILGIGKGQHEREMIRVVLESGYAGPIGILDHRYPLDTQDSLLENRDGIEWLRKELNAPGSGGALPPTPQAYAKPKVTDEANVERALPALTAEDHARVASLVQQAQASGDALEGARVFADARIACLSCHQVGASGGTVGPDLSAIAKERTPQQIVESILWPQREVAPEHVTWKILTADGNVVTGFKHRCDDDSLVIRDTATNELITVAVGEIEEEVAAGSVMPDGLTAAMSPQQWVDLIRFLSELGLDGKAPSEAVERVLANSPKHGPAEFPLMAAPLEPSNWPHATHHVNRDRVYDFYTKQAEHFREQPHPPMLVGAYPGLDGGDQGHWGNQNESDWADGRWNQTQLGSLQAGVFRTDDITVPRGVCVRLGEDGEMSACFNPDTLSFDAVWTGGFVKFSSVRQGFLDGLEADGTLVSVPTQKKSPAQREIDGPFEYHGFYRSGQRVVFSYSIGDVRYLDSAWVQDGEFVREVGPEDGHSLRHVTNGGPRQWPNVIETDVVRGDQRPYAIDTIELPIDNPWNALVFCGGHDFFDDGSALVCTMQGDVWRVTGLNSAAELSSTEQPAKARWTRFATGLHQALGLVIDDGQVYVQCRDQLTRLTDLNDDGEADFYECFSNALNTSPAGHDFVCGLERDNQGNFFTASGPEGLVRISPDGKKATVVATGFRNPDGVGILPDGTVTVPVSEGGWTPASAIHAIKPATAEDANEPPDQDPPHHGYGGPKSGEPPKLPMVFLPRGLDNSSGGQVYVDSPSFGPLADQLLHLSFGTGSWFGVLRDQVGDQLQGAIVPLAGDFLSGVHRGRFHPLDGQLYVSGMSGWGSYTPDDGCFQRVRFTGDAVQVPVGFHAHQNGIRITFAEPLDASVAADPASHFSQAWNYRYSGAYGSPEYSTTHYGIAGHDPLRIQSAHVLDDGRSLFLELPQLQPVNQLHLRMHVNRHETLSCNPAGSGHDLFITLHGLGEPFTEFEGYQPREKQLAVHPQLVDLASMAHRKPNPWHQEIANAREIEIETGSNLSYTTREFTAKAGEPLALTLSNPDVVPHNWVLVDRGALQHVGELGNQMIADPNAFARQYIPRSDRILAHTDIVSAGQNETIYFTAPDAPGRYPFLCTFPGHWMVMNGTMIVTQ